MKFLCTSRADGTMLVTIEEWVSPDPDRPRMPGVFTRLAMAQWIAKTLNREHDKRAKKARSKR